MVGGIGTAVAGSEAAGATKSATSAAINEQNSAMAQQAQLAAPYTGLGSSAISGLQSLLGITPAGTSPSSAATTSANQQAALANTPGYQFTQQQGTQNTLNAANASGLLNSGNTLTGLSEFNAGLADTTYQNAVSNQQNAVNTGQAAAAGQAANVGAGANSISSSLIGQGNTLAGIDANTIAGITKSIGGAANNYTTLNTLQGLSGGGGSGAYNPYLTDVIGEQSANEVNNQFGSPDLIAPT